MPDEAASVPFTVAARLWRLRDAWAASAEAPATRRTTARPLMELQRVSYDEYRQAQQALYRFNTLTKVHQPVLDWLETMRICDIRSVLDAGNSSGDLLFHMACAGVAPVLIGADWNPWARRSADMRKMADTAQVFNSAEVFSNGSKDNIDIIISSHFVHTLDDRELVSFLKWIEATAHKGWMICERRRHPALHFTVKWAVKLFSKNRLVRHDAPLSVSRGLTREEWVALLERAGIPRREVRLRRAFPFRYILTREKR